MRYLIGFSYDGTKFHGFQRQNDVSSVQKNLEEILSHVLEEEILIKGSGRTDAGVHALNQCAHFDSQRVINKEDVLLINKMLKGNIKINKLKVVDENFHARHCVKKKTYVYKINNGKYDKNKEGYYYQIGYKLNFKLMKKACKLFVGTHDFKNFVSGPRVDYTTTIYNAKFKVKNNIILIEFSGIGFYRYMVRHLVGAIIDVGKERVQLNTINNMLDNPSLDKKLSVAPAEGLYLVDIKY